MLSKAGDKFEEKCQNTDPKLTKIISATKINLYTGNIVPSSERKKMIYRLNEYLRKSSELKYTKFSHKKETKT